MIAPNDIIGKRAILELVLLLMGFGGIALSVLVGVLLASTSLFTPDEGLGVMYGVFIGIIGFTAGVCLVALSHILGYLRVIASGGGLGRTFE